MLVPDERRRRRQDLWIREKAMSPNQSIRAGFERAVPTNLAAARSPRRLAVVLAAHLSETVGTEGRKPLACIDLLRRRIVEPTLAENRGRLVRLTGCDLLAVFELPEDAVRCAVVLRNLLRSAGDALPNDRTAFRFGVDLGEVLVEAASVSGEAAVIAEQLAASARAGEVRISGGVYAQISNRLACKYTSLGETSLESVAYPVRVYGVSPLPVLGDRRAKLAGVIHAAASAAIAVPEQVSSAVRRRMEAFGLAGMPEDCGREVEPSSADATLAPEWTATVERADRALGRARAVAGPFGWSLVALFWRVCVMRGSGAWV